MLIPSIDLYDGKAVQWRQGREHVLEESDVMGLLERFSMYGQVAVVDLNAATGKGDNRQLIFDMLQKVPLRVGGGIRDLETARAYLKAGASKLVLGTAAREDWVAKLPREAVVVALDSKGDYWLRDGWRQTTDQRTDSVLAQLAPRAGEFLYTQVDKEGMLQGLDRERVQAVVAASDLPVTVAGGITDLDDIAFLNQLGAHAQIGMALYTGRISLDQAFLSMVDWDKAPLVPTVVRATNGDVLMLAYSNRESLQAALEQRRGIYFSRSRNKLWCKGESSGHIQQLRHVDLDCDGDTLLFTVDQMGPACHLNRWSCFPSVQPQFGLENLDTVLAQRRRDMPPGSYSAKLFQDADLQAEKLREECQELIEAETLEDVRWEAADVIYFALVMARAKNVGLQDIVAELRSRHANS